MTAIKLTNIIAFVIMVLMNYLANAIPLGGKTTGELSAQYPNLFVPAGVTFSIWGIIYLLLLGFIIIQFRTENRVLVASTGLLFAISCILNSLWIVAWHYENPGLSLLIMIFLLLSLILINHRINPFAMGISKAAFGIYLGWICIATIANATAFLVAINWTGWGLTDEFWATVMVLAGAIITILLLSTYRNPFTGLAVMWALAGIIIARSWPDHIPIIMAAAGSLIVIAIISSIISVRLVYGLKL
jgi:hypothetical protein